MDTSSDHLLHLNSPSLSSELQDTSSVGSVENEFVSDFEEPMESNNFLPTDVFSIQHDYDLFLLNQELHTPSDNLNHQDTPVCEKQGQDDYLIHATDLSHNFALPQFMTQHNCEDLKPIDLPESNPELNLIGRTFLLPPQDNGEILIEKVQGNGEKLIEKAKAMGRN